MHWVVVIRMLATGITHSLHKKRKEKETKKVKKQKYIIEWNTKNNNKCYFWMKCNRFLTFIYLFFCVWTILKYKWLPIIRQHVCSCCFLDFGNPFRRIWYFFNLSSCYTFVLNRISYFNFVFFCSLLTTLMDFALPPSPFYHRFKEKKSSFRVLKGFIA